MDKEREVHMQSHGSPSCSRSRRGLAGPRRPSQPSHIVHGASEFRKYLSTQAAKLRNPCWLYEQSRSAHVGGWVGHTALRREMTWKSPLTAQHQITPSRIPGATPSFLQEPATIFRQAARLIRLSTYAYVLFALQGGCDGAPDGCIGGCHNSR